MRSAAPEGVAAFCITPPSSAGSAASTADRMLASETPRNLPAWLARLWPTVPDSISSRLAVITHLLYGCPRAPANSRGHLALLRSPLLSQRMLLPSAHHAEQEVLRVVAALLGAVNSTRGYELVDLLRRHTEPRQRRVEARPVRDLGRAELVGRRLDVGIGSRHTLGKRVEVGGGQPVPGVRQDAAHTGLRLGLGDAEPAGERLGQGRGRRRHGAHRFAAGKRRGGEGEPEHEVATLHCRPPDAWWLRRC